MKSGGRLLAAVVVGMGLLVPATAQGAVTATLTGDDGQPAPLVAGGAPPTIRNMSATAAVQVTAPESGNSWGWWVTDQTGALAVPVECWNSITNDSNSVSFRGNGSYTLHQQYYTGSGCRTASGAETTFSWNVAASVAVLPAPGVLMTRPPNTSVTNTLQVGFQGNPGAQSYDIHYAKDAVLAPDGSISGPSLTSYLDSATGAIRFWNFSGPGRYTFVARAQSGDYFTAWSAPVTVTLMAPFDLSDVSFPDSIGPSYRLRGVVREAAGAAGSRVTVAWAKGSKGKRFHTLGKLKVNSQGAFAKRFHLPRGKYRLRFSFRGNDAVTRGSIYTVITIKRVLR